MTRHQKQLAAITRQVPKAKNPGKAKAKIRQLKIKKAWNDFLSR